MEFLSTEMRKSVKRKHVFSEFSCIPVKFMVPIKYPSRVDFRAKDHIET